MEAKTLSPIYYFKNLSCKNLLTTFHIRNYFHILPICENSGWVFTLKPFVRNEALQIASCHFSFFFFSFYFLLGKRGSREFLFELLNIFTVVLWVWTCWIPMIHLYFLLMRCSYEFGSWIVCFLLCSLLAAATLPFCSVVVPIYMRFNKITSKSQKLKTFSHSSRQCRYYRNYGVLLLMSLVRW